MQTPDIRLLEERNGVSFLECLEMSTQTELIQQWERLSGKKLVPSGIINQMVDKATGYDQVLFREFADFVYECVFSTF